MIHIARFRLLLAVSCLVAIGGGLYMGLQPAVATGAVLDGSGGTVLCPSLTTYGGGQAWNPEGCPGGWDKSAIIVPLSIPIADPLQLSCAEGDFRLDITVDGTVCRPSYPGGPCICGPETFEAEEIIVKLDDGLMMPPDLGSECMTQDELDLLSTAEFALDVGPAESANINVSATLSCCENCE